MPQKIIGGNRDVNGKIVLIGLAPEEGGEDLRLLTQRQIMALVSLCDTLSWMKRHLYLPDDIPNQIILNDWVDDLKVRLMTPIDFCQLMKDNAECFLTDETVQGLIPSGPSMEDILDEIKTNERRLTDDKLLGNLFNNATCSKDLMFNVCFRLVEHLNTTVMSMFSALEQLSNPNERVQLFMSALQSDVSYPIDELLIFMDDLLENVQEEYETRFQVNGTKHYEIACALLCLYEEDCELSTSDLIVFYLNNVNTELGSMSEPMDILNAIANFILTGDIPLDILVYTMQSLALSVINSGIPFLGNDYFSIKTVAKAASDVPNNDWIDYCDDCNESESCGAGVFFNFETSDMAFEVFAGYGVRGQWFSSGTRGWGRGTTTNRINIFRTILPRPQTRVKIITNEPVPLFVVYNYPSFTALSSANVYTLVGGRYEYVLNLTTPNTTQFCIEVQGSGALSTTLRILSMCVDY